MAIALSPTELERAIEVLSSAGKTLELTRFERITYRTLLISVDTAMASFLSSIVVVIFAAADELGDFLPNVVDVWPWWLAGFLILVFVISFIVGLISLALNIPLLIKTFREGKRLKQLGLDALSTSLWKESRRSRWISRLRGVLLVGIGVLILVGAVFASKGMIEANENADRGFFLAGVLAYALTAGLLFGARYLRNQRERMDMAASAERLRKAFQGLQQRPDSEFVSVPAELLERTANIESAQIKKERKEAMLQSASARTNAYAIAFERDAFHQRSMLQAEDRLELEDLVADLSMAGAQHDTRSAAAAGPEAPSFHCATESKKVEIEYVVDQEARRIRVVAVTHRGSPSTASADGAVNG